MALAITYTGELVLFATLGPKKSGKKSQYVAKKANTWQKKTMPGKKKSRVKIQSRPRLKSIEIG